MGLTYSDEEIAVLFDAQLGREETPEEARARGWEQTRKGLVNDVRRNKMYWAEYYMKEAQTYLAAARTAEEDVNKKFAEFLKVVDALDAAGVKWKRPYDLRVIVELKDKKDLVKVYRAVGRLDGANAYKSLTDVDQGVVTVTLSCVAYPDLTVKYPHKLTDKDRCKVETVVKVEKQLVCGR